MAASISAYSVAIGIKERLYPYEACIRSALEVADEFVVAYDPRFDDVGLLSDLDDRVKPVRFDIDFTVWDFMCKMLTFARGHCVGEWCLYLEMDEVLHEKDAQSVLDAVEDAIASNKEAVNVHYLEPWQGYLSPKMFNNSGACRQKITVNAPWLYHKTSDYMIKRIESSLWDGKAIIKPDFDDVAYYDSRKDGWFFAPDCPFVSGRSSLKAETPEAIKADLDTHAYLWHYAWYNGSRKYEQGNQTAIWQARVNGVTTEMDIDRLIDLLQEQIVINNQRSRQYLEYAMENYGMIAVDMQHPAGALDWVESMTIQEEL